MGKASTRRKRNRLNYLSRLCREDPEGFRREWDKRIESAAGEAAWRARSLRDGEGRRVGTAFEVLDRTLELLHACGGAQLPDGEGSRVTLATTTRETLADRCTRAVAAAADRRLGKGPRDV